MYDRFKSDRTAISPRSTVRASISDSLATKYVSVIATGGNTELGNMPVVILLALVQSILGTLPKPTSALVT